MSAPQLAEATTPLTLDLVDAVGDAFNRNDIDAVMAFFADDAVFDHGAGPDVQGQSFVSKEAIRAVFQALFDNVENVNWATRDTRIAGEKAYCEFHRTATLKSGEKQDFYSFDIMTFRDGLIVHKDTYFKHRS